MLIPLNEIDTSIERGHENRHNRSSDTCNPSKRTPSRLRRPSPNQVPTDIKITPTLRRTHEEAAASFAELGFRRGGCGGFVLVAHGV